MVTPDPDIVLPVELQASDPVTVTFPLPVCVPPPVNVRLEVDTAAFALSVPPLPIVTLDGLIALLRFSVPSTVKAPPTDITSDALVVSVPALTVKLPASLNCEPAANVKVPPPN